MATGIYLLNRDDDTPLGENNQTLIIETNPPRHEAYLEHVPNPSTIPLFTAFYDTKHPGSDPVVFRYENGRVACGVRRLLQKEQLRRGKSLSNADMRNYHFDIDHNGDGMINQEELNNSQPYTSSSYKIYVQGTAKDLGHRFSNLPTRMKIQQTIDDKIKNLERIHKRSLSDYEKADLLQEMDHNNDNRITLDEARHYGTPQDAAKRLESYRKSKMKFKPSSAVQPKRPKQFY